MSRRQWKQLSEPEREAIRQHSAAQSLAWWRAEQRWNRSMDVWQARDVYRVQSCAVALGLLAGLGFLLVLGGLVHIYTK